MRDEERDWWLDEQRRRHMMALWDSHCSDKMGWPDERPAPTEQEMDRRFIHFRQEQADG